MKHGKKFNHLSRKSQHRKAMLSNMATSLIIHKRITTTVAKAKALKKYVEPLITKAKEDSTHSRRIVFSYLKQKDPIKELFEVVADKIGDRPGGYTRIIKTGTRLGDNAETCIIELVDFNDIYVKETKKKSTRRRSRRSGTKPESEVVPEVNATDEVVAEVEDTKEEVVESAEVETPSDEAVEEKVEEAVEEKVEEEPPVAETNEDEVVKNDEASEETKKEDSPEDKKE